MEEKIDFSVLLYIYALSKHLYSIPICEYVLF